MKSPRPDLAPDAPRPDPARPDAPRPDPASRPPWRPPGTRTLRRILIVDDDPPIRSLLLRALTRTGHAIEVAADGALALERIQTWRPDLILLDLMMPRVDGFGVLEALRADPILRTTQVVVITARLGREALEAAFDAGADDYIGKPFDLAEILARVAAQLRIADWRETLDRRRRDGEILLEISHRLTRRLDIQGILQDITAMLVDVLGTDRCSVVLLGRDGETGRVVAASDDLGLTDRTIHLADYPEIRQVITTRAPLVVADIGADPLFDPIKENLARLDVRSVALFPLLEGRHCIGVLFLRATRRRDDFGERETQFGAIVANATAIAITNARLFRELREETHRISHARAIVEERLRAVQRYEDFFESSADGMFITDPQGRVLFVNREAERLVGRPRTDAIGQPFTLLCDPADHAAAHALFADARRGDFSHRVDLRLPADRIASVSAARIPDEDALALSARDVTDDRALARALADTRRRLAEQEKLTVIAEIAGAAAHELNQPLTSVMGYAELLQRHLDPADALAQKAAATIQREAERMADIVRRIGRLTRYETRPYIGDERILDLAASSPPQEPDDDGEPPPGDATA